jgi:2,6-dihydroxypseudooxynicotine hydrolase
MDQLPQVEAVWRRWEPRFIAAGTDYNIMLKLKSEIQDWTEWCQKWSEKAADLEIFGDEAMERGHIKTAALSWNAAAMLYQFGGMYYIYDMDQFYESHRKKLAAFAKAAPHFDPPVERFEVSYDGVQLACYLRVPKGVEKPPVVIFNNGFEGVKEELHQRTHWYLDRGLATLTWDGAGRGETWEHMPMSGHNGPLVAAIIDYLETRDDVDATRIGASGPNRGGFAGVKAAAYEPRIKALGVASPGYDRRVVKWDDPYEIAFMLHLFHLKTEEELRDRIMNQTDFTLEGEAENIKCPTLIIAGGQDAGPQYEGSVRLYNEVQGPKEWVVFPDAERNGNNVPYKVRPRLAVFMADSLGALS